MNTKTNVTVEVRDAETKKIIRIHETHNVLTIGGLNWMRDLMGGTEVRASTINLGTVTTAGFIGQTALYNQIYVGAIDRRIPTDVSYTPYLTHKIFLTTADANGNDLGEVGLFRGNLMIARAALDPVITKTSLVELTISHALYITTEI